MAAFRGFLPRISGQPESRRRWPLCLRRTACSGPRFVMVTLAVPAFETGRGLCLLPPGCLFWANGNGGYVMGWAIAGDYPGRVGRSSDRPQTHRPPLLMREGGGYLNVTPLAPGAS